MQNLNTMRIIIHYVYGRNRDLIAL